MAGIDLWMLLNTDGFDYERVLKSRVMSPEKALMIAVLADAISEVRYPKLGKDGGFAYSVFEAVEWFLSPNNSHVFSFASVCDGLGFDPGYILRGIRPALDELKILRRGGRKPTARLVRSMPPRVSPRSYKKVVA